MDSVFLSRRKLSSHWTLLFFILVTKMTKKSESLRRWPTPSRAASARYATARSFAFLGPCASRRLRVPLGVSVCLSASPCASRRLRVPLGVSVRPSASPCVPRRLRASLGVSVRPGQVGRAEVISLSDMSNSFSGPGKW